LDSGLNNFFEVDSVNSMAYRYGRLGGVNTLSTVSLLTGTAETVSYGGDPFAVYNGQLLSSSGTAISIFDVATGESTFLAFTGLDSGLNNFFEVDSVNSMAYRYGRLGGVNT
ncbi:hypothetical protein, partial [Haloferula rosea]